jgi:hypothetical protein
MLTADEMRLPLTDRPTLADPLVLDPPCLVAGDHDAT